MDDELLTLIEKHEGFKSFVYKCTAGKLTVGFGHNLESMPMTKNAARHILKDDIGIIIRELTPVLPDLSTYSKNRQMGLISMAFNLGIPRFKTFIKMLNAVYIKDWGSAAEHMKNSNYYNQVGNRGKEIYKLIKEG